MANESVGTRIDDTLIGGHRDIHGEKAAQMNDRPPAQHQTRAHHYEPNECSEVGRERCPAKNPERTDRNKVREQHHEQRLPYEPAIACRKPCRCSPPHQQYDFAKQPGPEQRQIDQRERTPLQKRSLPVAPHDEFVPADRDRLLVHG